MRIKNGFVIREVAGQTMVIATGEASKNFHGMIKLNCTGRHIWEGLLAGLSEDEIANKLQEEYQIAEEVAKQDTRAFLARMKEMGFLTND